jgi:hypothetical protein
MTTFAVAPLRKLARVSVVGLLLILPIALIGLGVVSSRPAGPGVWLALSAALAVSVLIAAATARRAIVLEADRLTVKAAIYTRRVMVSEIDLERARVLDLAEHPELRPGLKTNGFALPGFSAGHFRGRDRGKMFCLLTDNRVLDLPLTDGSRLLISPERPQAVLDALRQRAPGRRQADGS